MPIVIALYAIVVVLLVAAFALGWCHYDRHRILCFQASGPTSLIERPTIRIHPDTQRTCDNLGVAELVFLAIALIATYVRFFQQCYPHTVPFLLIGIVACLGITTVPLQLHALGACARWRKRRRLGPISDEELFARVSARDILPAQSAKHDFLYPQLSQPYCLAEKRELRDRIIQVRTDREGQLSFNRQKYLGLHSNNSRELATVDPDQFADRYDAAVETEILLRQAIHEDETFVAQQERMINGLDSRLQAAKRLASQLTFRR